MTRRAIHEFVGVALLLVAALSLSIWLEDGTLGFVLGVGAAVLLLVVVTLPGMLFRRFGAMLLAIAAVAIAVSLSIYAFGEDTYTSNGQSYWDTHDSTWSHGLWVLALLAVLLVAFTAVFLRHRPRLLRLATGCAVITLPPLWFISVIALVSN